MKEQTKQNPFRKWEYKEGMIGQRISNNWDSMNTPLSPHYSVKCPSKLTTRHCRVGEIDLGTLMTECFYNVGFAGASSTSLGPVDFRELEKAFIANYDLDKRSHLATLPSIVSDPVAQKLIGIFERIRSKSGEIWYGCDLPFNDFKVSHEDKKVLEKISDAYWGLCTRTMKQDEYEFLANASYNQFKRKLEGVEDGKK